MKQRAKVIQIPAAATEAQIETALNNLIDAGWQLVDVFTLGTKVYAVLVKEISK